MRRATIKDVAERAGVAISTASNALNGTKVVTPTTREKVLAAAKALNYTPNLIGQRLRSGQTNVIGLYTASVAGPYFYVLVEAIAKAADAAGYGLTVTLMNDHQALMSSLLGNTCDGAIIFSPTITDDDLHSVTQQHLPTVVLDRPMTAEYLSSIIFDSFEGGYQVAKYLLGLGHRRFAFIGGLKENLDSNERFRGIQAALKEARLDPEQVIFLHGRFEEQASYDAVTDYLGLDPHNRVTAFIAGNDLSALGAIKAIQNAGFSVPKDFSVTGFDDIDISAYYRPSLTTFHNPIERQGQQAVREVLSMISGGNHAGTKQLLKGQLIKRASTGSPTL